MAAIGRSWKIGVCPICQRQGIAWCAGGIGDAHDTAGIEVVEVVPAEQLRGAVEERDRYRKEAQRFRTIMASASELQPADCRRRIRDALRGSHV